MKLILACLVILTSYPVFAACPIDGSTDACVAEFNVTIPTNTPMPKIKNNFNKAFEGIKDTTPISKEIGPDSTRLFGPTTQDYNYNSSCQFGVCRDTGTPTSITGEN